MRKLINGSLIAGIIVLLVLIAPSQSLWVQAAFILGIYALKPLILVIPTNSLYVAAGLLFPFPIALSITVSGLFLNMTSGYLLGKYLGIGPLTKYLHYLEALKRFSHSPKYLCFLTRLIFFPIDPLNWIFGAMRVKFSDFVLFTYLGMVPKAVIYLTIGETVSSTFLPLLFPL